MYDIIQECSKKLLDVRSARRKPGLDDKMLTSWNSLMITAMAKGARVSGDEKYMHAAQSCLEFIENKCTTMTACLIRIETRMLP